LSLALGIVRKQADTRDNTEKEIDILLSLRSLVGATGKYLEAERLIEDAEKRVTRIGDARRHAAVITLKVHLLNVLGELDRALDLGKQAVAAARRWGDDLLAGRAMFGLGQTYFNRGDFLEASRAFLDSVEYARRAPQALRLTLGTQSVTAQASRAIALSYREDFAEAAKAAEAAHRLAQATRRPYELAFTELGHGLLDLQRCRPEPALAKFRAGIRLAEERDLEHLFPPLMAALGHGLLLQGSIEDAAHWLTRAYEASRRDNRYMMQVWAATGLAAAHLRSGRQGAALRHSDEAVRLCRELGIADNSPRPA
jgi:tetratricopeptide (TPR) repeat protein